MAHTLGLRRTPRGSRRGGGARVEREEAILSDTTAPRVALSRLRARIDNIAAALIYLLAERFRSTTQVGHLKAEHGMPASDPAREEQQIARLRALAAAARKIALARIRAGKARAHIRQVSVPIRQVFAFPAVECAPS